MLLLTEITIPEELQGTIKLSSVPLYFSERSNQKRISLTYVRDKKYALIKAPPRTLKRTIKNFVQQNTEWLIKQVQKPSPQKRSFIPGEIIPYMGQPLTLVHTATNRIAITVEGNNLHVKAAESRIQHHLKKWLYEKAHTLTTKHSHHFAKMIGVSIKRIAIKDTKTRWGSCSSLGNLNFNWRLILAPEPILSYVCAHEVAHLIHMDHSDAFWSLVQKMDPNMKQSRQWLKRNGHSLHAYG